MELIFCDIFQGVASAINTSPPQWSRGNHRQSLFGWSCYTTARIRIKSSAGTSSTTIKFNDYFAYLASAEELANSLDEADEQDKLAALNEAIQNAKSAYDGLPSLPNLQQKNVDDIVAALKAAITAAMA